MDSTFTAVFAVTLLVTARAGRGGFMFVCHPVCGGASAAMRRAAWHAAR